ncbi:MAG: hypothetical protein COB36_02955 [Alphaproteobacteria bacterium]|nr:MAG: hypothetical protein COB36_02955 [Alphaproteobacteria bacterium]
MTTIQETNNSHDFEDGNGSVRAHRHPNGNGWVADTATVDDTAYVGVRARVFGYAKIKDKARIRQYASISGSSIIKDQACIKGQAVIRGSCTINGDVEISGDTVIIRHTTEDIILNENSTSFKARDCLGCPALLDDNYTGSNNNPCLYCLEKLSIATEDDRSSIQSWMSKNEAMNTNTEAEEENPSDSKTG